MKLRQQDDWRELKARVASEIKRREISRFGGIGVISKVALLGFALCASFFYILNSEPSLLWLLSWAVLGTATFFLLVVCAHDASHEVLFRSRTLNRLALIIPFGLFGIDGSLWGLRHLVAHHPRTNIDSDDPDSVPNPFLRLSPHHPWRPWFKLQSYYAIFLYMWALAHTAIIQDFDHVLNKPLPYLKKINTRWALTRLLLVKGIHLGIFIGIPLACGLPLYWIVAGLIVKTTTASLIFVSTIALNHYVMETTFYPAETEKPEESYLLHHLKSSADWHAKSRFVCSIMGGANAHVAHHLFPYLSHRHYHWVSEIIEDFCRERSLPYHQFTFLGGVASHYEFLRTLGRRPTADAI